MPKYAVATVDEISAGQRKVVEVADRVVGIFNLEGEFFALRNTCPHQGGPLCSGRVTGFLHGQPGALVYSRQGEILRCPWHGWEFDIRTGQSWHNPARVRVRAYEVSVNDGPVEGPYKAESFDVEVRGQVVYVDIPGAAASPESTDSG